MAKGPIETKMALNQQSKFALQSKYLYDKGEANVVNLKKAIYSTFIPLLHYCNALLCCFIYNF